jgi:hypothetical protein
MALGQGARRPQVLVLCLAGAGGRMRGAAAAQRVPRTQDSCCHCCCALHQSLASPQASRVTLLLLLLLLVVVVVVGGRCLSGCEACACASAWQLNPPGDLVSWCHR